MFRDAFLSDARTKCIDCQYLCLGLPVLTEGTAAVIDALRGCGALLREDRYSHKYPYDWRTKQPTIFRATSQVRGEALQGHRA